MDVAVVDGQIGAGRVDGAATAEAEARIGIVAYWRWGDPAFASQPGRIVMTVLLRCGND